MYEEGKLQLGISLVEKLVTFGKMWILLSLFVIGTVSGELFNIKIQDDGSAFSTAG